MTKFILFAIVAATVVFVACNQKNASQTKEISGEPDKPAVTEEPTSEMPKEKAYQVIGFQKTPCFGKCPVYEVKFFSDGTATYHGRMNVDREGWYEARLEKKVIKDIQAKADAIGYWDFYEKYPLENQVADLPSTITTVRVGDMIKTVRNTHDAPAKLVEFENYLSGIIEGLDWKGVEKK